MRRGDGDVLAPNEQLTYLIDEDDIVRDSLKVLLESHGMTVRDYRSAAEFTAEPAPRAGCLVLSHNRAIGSGLDLAAALRRRGVAIPVIFMVGGGDATTRAAAQAAGAFAYIERPVEETALIRAVSAALARKGAAVRA
jgi:two-component system response regulator FixJ